MIRSRQRPRVGGGSGAFGSLAMRLDLLSSTSLDQRVTFSRGTNATLIDSTGTLTYAPSNQVLNSESFTATSWTGVGTTGLSSVGSNATVAPDGTTTADSLVEDSLTSDHRINQSGISGSAGAGKYAFSVYLKAGTRTFARIQFDGTINAVGSSCGVNVNLLDGSFSTPTNVGNITSATATVTDVGNGWYRVGLLATLSTVYSFTGASVRIFTMQSLSGSTSFLGNGSNIFVWGAQFGAMTYETAPRTYNSTTPKNLLGYTEEFDNAAWTKTQAYIQTNLNLQSQTLNVSPWIVFGATVTADAISAPDGTLTADFLKEDLTTTSHQIYQFTPTISTLYTTSIYAKAGTRSKLLFTGGGFTGQGFSATFDLSNGTMFTNAGNTATITNVGNGWYRCIVTFTTSIANVFAWNMCDASGSSSYTGDGTSGLYLWGAQVVQGSTAGNYQQTLAATAPVQYIDPNGYLTADKLVEDNTTNAHFFVQSIAFTGLVTYTASIYAKAAERQYVQIIYTAAAFGASKTAGFDLSGSGSTITPAGTTSSITSVGNGWYRCSITATTTTSATSSVQFRTATSLSTTPASYLGDGASGAFFWGAQVSDSASVDPYVYNPAAAITSAAYYGPRFDYNPNVEYSTNNLISYAYPQNFSSSNWVKVRSTAPATTATADPTGTYTAYKLTEDTTATNTHLIQIQGALTSVTAGVEYTISVYIKAAERTSVQFAISNDNGAFTVNGGTINLTTGDVSGTTGAAPITTDVGNGWWRCSITATATADAIMISRLFLINGTTTYTGDGTSGVYIWGAQLVANNAPTPFYYYPLNPLGLLIEEARTNLMFPADATTGWAASPASCVTVTANAATSPDGTTNATKLATNDTATNGHTWYKTYTGAVSTAYCGSVYLKAGEYTRAQMAFDNSSFAVPTGALFDLAAGTVVGTGGGSTATITPVGNGWYRCSITATSVATSGNYVVTLAPVPASVTSFNNTFTSASTGLGVYVYGVQVEAAGFATSLIPTVSAFVTRSADIATMVGNNFTNWYNEANGTISASADTVVPSGTTAILSFQDAAGSSTNRHQLSMYSNCAATVLSGTVQATLGLNTLQTLKAAYGYQDNNFGFSANGGTVALDTLGTVPLSIGYATLGRWDYGVGATINGHIQSISYYNTRLTDAQLQAVSA